MSEPVEESEVIAVWETENGFSAIVPDWQLDLAFTDDGEGSVIDANSVQPSFISFWRKTTVGKVTGHALAKMIIMAARAKDRPVHHFFLREERRRIEREEFVGIVEEFARKMKDERLSEQDQ